MKLYRHISEQRKYLVEKKNIIDDVSIETLLIERAYVSLINPYKKLLSSGLNNNKEHIYIKTIDIEQYKEIAMLDDALSEIIYYLVSIFEKKFKRIIATSVCEKMYEDGDHYSISYYEILKKKYLNSDFVCLDDNNIEEIGFNCLRFKYTKDGLKIINTNIQADYDSFVYSKQYFEQLLAVADSSKRAKSGIVKHYQKKENIIPFWLLIHEMSFGDLRLIYGLLSKELREKIYVEINNEVNVSPKKIKQFETKLGNINDIRNTVNHYESFLVKADCDKNVHKSIISTIDFLIKFSINNSYYKEIDQLNDAIIYNLSVNDYNKQYLNHIKEIISTIYK